MILKFLFTNQGIYIPELKKSIILLKAYLQYQSIESIISLHLLLLLFN